MQYPYFPNSSIFSRFLTITALIYWFSSMFPCLYCIWGCGLCWEWLLEGTCPASHINPFTLTLRGTGVGDQWRLGRPSVSSGKLSCWKFHNGQILKVKVVSIECHYSHWTWIMKGNCLSLWGSAPWWALCELGGGGKNTRCMFSQLCVVCREAVCHPWLTQTWLSLVMTCCRLYHLSQPCFFFF